MKSLPKNILLIDNYDSFTFNIVHLLNEIGISKPTIVKNDEIPFDEFGLYDAVILSPGPGTPDIAGDLMKFLDLFINQIPILGICLGHQAIGMHFGARMERLPQIYHGSTSALQVLEREVGVFGLCRDADIVVGRYNSWTLLRDDWPEELIISALDSEGHIMGLRHRTLPVEGIQFHPESYMTPMGSTMISSALADLSHY